MKAGKSKLTIISDQPSQIQSQTDPIDMILQYCCHYDVCPKCAAEGDSIEHVDPRIEPKPFLIFLQNDHVMYTGHCKECNAMWNEEARIPRSMDIRRFSSNTKKTLTDLNNWNWSKKMTFIFWIIVGIAICLFCIWGLAHVEEGSTTSYLFEFGIVAGIGIGVCGWIDYLFQR